MLAKKLVQKGVQGRRFRRRANVKGTGGDSAPQLGVEASEEQLVVARHAAEHCVLGAVALLRNQHNLVRKWPKEKPRSGR